MGKKIILTKTLGPKSAHLVGQLIESGKVIFSLEDACKIYGQNRQETTHFLRSLVNRGVLARLKSGIFLILQMGQENTQLSNWPLIAKAISGKNDYYISHLAAMRLYGMTTHPLLTVTISMTKRSIAKKINDIAYQFVYLKRENFWGTSNLWVTKHEKVCVSELERTILDGLDRPDLCGGIKEIAKGIWRKQKSIDWEKLTHYAKKYHSKAAVKRLGFILQTLNIGISCISSLEELISLHKDYVSLDPNETKSGKYLSRWKLQINIEIDEIKESIWE